MKKKLSICVPTFNRRNQLEQTLTRCIAEINSFDLNCDVEILIGDNNSSDGTHELGGALSRGNECIQYFRNSRNIGAEANWTNLINLAQGEYVWILSDDDYFSPGIVFDILRIVNAGTYDVIFLNYSFFSFIENKIAYKNLKTKISSDKSGFGYQNFFLESNFLSSLISSNVLNRDAFLSALPLMEDVKKNPWLLLYSAKTILQKKAAWYILSEPKLSMQSIDMMVSRAYAYKTADHFHFNAHIEFVIFQKILNEGCSERPFESAIPELHMQIMYAKFSWHKLTAKEDYSYWLKASWRIIKTGQYNSSLKFWLCEIPLMLLPSIFARAFYSYHSNLRPLILSWVINGSNSTNSFQKLAYFCYARYKKI